MSSSRLPNLQRTHARAFQTWAVAAREEHASCSYQRAPALPLRSEPLYRRIKKGSVKSMIFLYDITSVSVKLMMFLYDISGRFAGPHPRHGAPARTAPQRAARSRGAAASVAGRVPRDLLEEVRERHEAPRELLLVAPLLEHFEALHPAPGPPRTTDPPATERQSAGVSRNGCSGCGGPASGGRVPRACTQRSRRSRRPTARAPSRTCGAPSRARRFA
jgi:hypothetical protein